MVFFGLYWTIAFLFSKSFDTDEDIQTIKAYHLMKSLI